MKGKKRMLVVVSFLLVVLLAAGAVISYKIVEENSEKAAAEQAERALLTFGGYTDCEVFADVPTMQGEEISFSNAEDSGDGDYTLRADNTTLAEYKAYLDLLSEEGYTKYADNGEEGIEGYVYTSYWQKGDKLVVVSWFSELNQTLIRANEEGEVLTDRLIYSDAFAADDKEGAQTSLHLKELYAGGQSVIIQMKNGHFIMNDGGVETELPYLLDYLEALVPEGEKPVIEAWFVSHSHSDHAGAFKAMYNDSKYAERVIVESVYFHEPSAAAVEAGAESENIVPWNMYIMYAAGYLKNSEGGATAVYRMRTGDRYYFSDFSVDVVYASEMVYPETEWSTYRYSWNGTCTMLTYNIEGQKAFITGDADFLNQVKLMDMYPSAYFDLDVYQPPHHGKNVFIEFLNYCTRISTAVYTSPASADIGNDAAELHFLGKRAANEYLRSVAEEWMSFNDGGWILTFPYQVGEAVNVPMTEWIYHLQPPKRQQTTQ